MHIQNGHSSISASGALSGFEGIHSKNTVNRCFPSRVTRRRTNFFIKGLKRKLKILKLPVCLLAIFFFVFSQSDTAERNVLLYCNALFSIRYIQVCAAEQHSGWSRYTYWVSFFPLLELYISFFLKAIGYITEATAFLLQNQKTDPRNHSTFLLCFTLPLCNRSWPFPVAVI